MFFDDGRVQVRKGGSQNAKEGGPAEIDLQCHDNWVVSWFPLLRSKEGCRKNWTRQRFRNNNPLDNGDGGVVDADAATATATAIAVAGTKQYREVMRCDD